jgi:hypothetical protein
MVARLEQGDRRLSSQRVRRRQTRDPGADHRHALQRAPPARQAPLAVSAHEKTVVRRPAANEGGREEEESRRRISVGLADRPHNSENFIIQPLRPAERWHVRQARAESSSASVAVA